MILLSWFKLDLNLITGANSGHYTAYAKHAVDGKWYYYNDETVSENHPGDDEFTSTYVLFYQRKGITVQYK